MTVKRYDFGTEYRGNTGVPAIVGKVDGRYVRYEDYAALLAKVEAIGASGVSTQRITTAPQPADPTKANFDEAAKTCRAMGADTFAKCFEEAAQPAEPDVLPGEAILGFSAWLTCLRTPVTFSECHDAAIGAELAASYNASQGFDQVREDFHKRLKPGPKDEPAHPAEPVKVRHETTSEHIARDIREGRFPAKSDRKMVPVEPVKVPSDEQLAELFGMWGWRTKDGRELRFSHFKEMVQILLARYGHPATAEGWQLIPSEPTEMPNGFGEWFAKNYPGPETIIHDPSWHAPRIWRAAIHHTLKAVPKFGEEE